MTALNSPVLVVGPTRSGKSLLASALAELPEFVHLHESITIWDLGPSGSRDARRDASEATPDVIRGIRDELSRRTTAAGCNRFVEDLPQMAFRIPFAHRVLPEARFILITRDPQQTIPAMKWGWTVRDSLSGVVRRKLGDGRRRSVKLSKLAPYAWQWTVNRARAMMGKHRLTWGPTVPGQLEFARDHSLIEVIAFQWASMVDSCIQGLSELPAELVFLTTFERLTTQPDQFARDFSRWCDLDDSAFCHCLRSVLLPEKIPPRVADVSDAEWQLAMQWVGPGQERLSRFTAH